MFSGFSATINTTTNNILTITTYTGDCGVETSYEIYNNGGLQFQSGWGIANTGQFFCVDDTSKNHSNASDPCSYRQCHGRLGSFPPAFAPAVPAKIALSATLPSICVEREMTITNGRM